MSGRVFEKVEDFGAVLPDKGGLIGLDLGTKTIGVAVSDATRFIATPLTTLQRRKFTVEYATLAVLIAERSIVGIVLGWPLNMDGSEGPRAQSTRAFAREMAKRSLLPLLLWDERLSTAWAERRLIEQDASRATRSQVIDRMAAGFILQGALDTLRASRDRV